MIDARNNSLVIYQYKIFLMITDGQQLKGQFENNT